MLTYRSIYLFIYLFIHLFIFIYHKKDNSTTPKYTVQDDCSNTNIPVMHKRDMYLHWGNYYTYSILSTYKTQHVICMAPLVWGQI